MKRVLLIDADLVAFTSSSATENVWDFSEEGGEAEGPTVIADFDEARASAQEKIDKYVRELRADEVVICLSDLEGGNFRKTLAPDIYKAKRNGLRRPENLVPIKRWLADTYKSYWRPHLEGDDVAGILATHPTLVPGDKIVVSDDKDMRQIPGKLYVPRTGEKLKITELDADRWHMRQTLTGDTTDGYGGCPRVGPKSPYVSRLYEAETIADMWTIVIEAYRSAFGTKTKVKRKTVSTPDESDRPVDAAILQARLARILRWSDYDKDAKAPRLWNPPVSGLTA